MELDEYLKKISMDNIRCRYNKKLYIDQLINRLNKYGVWINYENNYENSSRFVLTDSNRLFSDDTFSITYKGVAKEESINNILKYCNGTVISITNKQEIDIVSRPPPTIKLCKDAITSCNFKVYELEDGCITTLYYYNGWTLSSAKAYDSSKYSFRNINLFEIIKEYISFDKLDVNKSY